jgi:hypothetical protein
MKYCSFLLILLVLAVCFSNSAVAQGIPGLSVIIASRTNSGEQVIRRMNWQHFRVTDNVLNLSFNI